MTCVMCSLCKRTFNLVLLVLLIMISPVMDQGFTQYPRLGCNEVSRSHAILNNVGSQYSSIVIFHYDNVYHVCRVNASNDGSLWTI
jgi:hypothetical protein